jgi:hypothetical protein
MRTLRGESVLRIVRLTDRNQRRRLAEINRGSFRNVVTEAQTERVGVICADLGDVRGP